MIRVQSAPWSHLDPSELPGLGLEVKKAQQDVISQKPEKEFGGKVPNETNVKSESATVVVDKDKRDKTIPAKEFVERESLLTTMFQVKEFQGIYNIFLIMLINLTIYTLLLDYFENGRIELYWTQLRASFGKPLKTLWILLSLHLASVLIFLPFKAWVLARRSANIGKYRIFLDVIFASGVLSFTSFYFYIPISLHWTDPLPPASAAIIVLEQVRLFMKMYAFLRTKAPFAFSCKNQSISQNDSPVRQLTPLDNNKNRDLRRRRPEQNTYYENDSIVAEDKSDDTAGIPIHFSQYLYYLFAPTLIYRDTYPRSKGIRWTFILTNTIELCGCIFIYNLLHNLCGYTRFEKFGIPGHKMTGREFLDSLFFQMIPGGLGFLLGFFVLLHTSQNIFAELLRFGDRQFYKDWWNSSTFSSFYRNWNLPVHGFLYTYIYKETKELGFRSKFVPAIGVFFVSAVVHEYCLAFVLRFFYPVLLVFFGGFGVVLNFVQTPRFGGNPFIWWSLITGKGLILFFYSIEYFARLNNCPAAENQLLDIFIPRSWNCNAFQWTMK